MKELDEIYKKLQNISKFLKLETINVIEDLQDNILFYDKVRFNNHSDPDEETVFYADDPLEVSKDSKHLQKINKLKVESEISEKNTKDSKERGKKETSVHLKMKVKSKDHQNAVKSMVAKKEKYARKKEFLKKLEQKKVKLCAIIKKLKHTLDTEGQPDHGVEKNLFKREKRNAPQNFNLGKKESYQTSAKIVKTLKNLSKIKKKLAKVKLEKVNSKNRKVFSKETKLFHSLDKALRKAH